MSAAAANCNGVAEEQLDLPDGHFLVVAMVAPPNRDSREEYDLLALLRKLRNDMVVVLIDTDVRRISAASAREFARALRERKCLERDGLAVWIEDELYLERRS